MNAVLRKSDHRSVWDTFRGPVYCIGEQYYLEHYTLYPGGYNIHVDRITKSEARCLCTEENKCQPDII